MGGGLTGGSSQLGVVVLGGEGGCSFVKGKNQRADTMKPVPQICSSEWDVCRGDWGWLKGGQGYQRLRETDKIPNALTLSSPTPALKNASLK